jgi:hypothetical protein
MIDRERSKCVRAERDHKREHRFISATVGALNCHFRLLRFVRSNAMSPSPEQAGSRRGRIDGPGGRNHHDSAEL